MTGLPRRIAISGLLLTLACTRESAEPSDPEQAVRSYFDAVGRRDCPALERSVAEAAATMVTTMGCERLFDEFVEHGLTLDTIESVVVDGRDPSLRLVRARVREGAAGKVLVIGVRVVEGQWAVVRI